jgi:hypothetical protein
MPFVDGSLLQVRKHLLRQYKEVSAAAGVLNKVHTRIIADRLSLLLSATVGAFTLAARAAGRPVYEAESRHDWDALLYRFYVGTDEIISPNVLLVSIDTATIARIVCTDCYPLQAGMDSSLLQERCC